MSLSRSPSPGHGGGWASPGLNIGSGRSSPTRGFTGSSATPVMWESSRLKRGGGAGYPSFSTKNQGFFGRHMRRISSSLPRFSSSSHYAEKEKLGRGRCAIHGVPLLGRTRGVMARMGRKMKIRLLILFLILLSICAFYNTRECPPRHPGCGLGWHPANTCGTAMVYHWRRAAWLGGGRKFVIILGANVGGGVMEWKGAREWAIERDSVRNKKKYVSRWGYDLEIVDMSTKKRYAHEWRESWEKVDFIRTALRKYPQAEWYVC